MDLRHSKNCSHIPDIAGMSVSENQGAQSGFNCSFNNGWIVTVRGNPDESQYLVFISQNGQIRQIPGLIDIKDNNRPDDEKKFLDRLELRELLNTVSRLK